MILNTENMSSTNLKAKFLIFYSILLPCSPENEFSPASNTLKKLPHFGQSMLYNL